MIPEPANLGPQAAIGKAEPSAAVIPDPWADMEQWQDMMGDLARLPDDLKAEVRHHIREMHPRAAAAGGPSFILSVSNCVSNKLHARIMPILELVTPVLPGLPALADAREHSSPRQVEREGSRAEQIPFQIKDGEG